MGIFKIKMSLKTLNNGYNTMSTPLSGINNYTLTYIYSHYRIPTITVYKYVVADIVFDTICNYVLPLLIKLLVKL